MPAISIITINLHNRDGLQQTMESVFAQTFHDYEYIVVDGGSTDGSKEYIEEHADKLQWWVSEKDSGIYNAMNKGIRHATGDYVLLLNSGDYLYKPGSLAALFEGSDNRDFVFGNLLVNEKDGRQWVYKFPNELSFGFFFQSSLPHQATLIKRSLFTTIGLYNERYKVVSDWEFCMNAICKNHCTYQHADETISVFNMGGISTHSKNIVLVQKERAEVFNEGYFLFIKDYQNHNETQAELDIYRRSKTHSLVKKIRSVFTKTPNSLNR